VRIALLISIEVPRPNAWCHYSLWLEETGNRQRLVLQGCKSSPRSFLGEGPWISINWRGLSTLLLHTIRRAFRFITPSCSFTSRAKGHCAFAELEEELNVTNGGISRAVAAMGETRANGRPGYRLLEVYRDPLEPRRYQVRLSSYGQALFKQLRDS